MFERLACFTGIIKHQTTISPPYEYLESTYAKVCVRTEKQFFMPDYSLIAASDYIITTTDYIISASDYIISGCDLEIIRQISIFVCKERKDIPIASKTIYIQQVWQDISNRK